MVLRPRRERASTSQREYQRLREHVAEHDVVVAHELNRLGRSFADLAGFIEDLREKGVDSDGNAAVRRGDEDASDGDRRSRRLPATYRCTRRRAQ